MKNLLLETIEVLSAHNKEPRDVVWVGDEYGYTTWEDFKNKANITYDNGWGGNEVQMSLVVVGRDWWLERHEYDGSEWWEFKTIPQKPSELLTLGNVFGGYANQTIWEEYK